MAKKSQIKVKAKKPSTYAALSAVLGGLAGVLPQYGVLLGSLAVLVGGLGTVLPDPLDLAASRREVEAP